MNNEDLLKLADGTHPLQEVVKGYLRGEVVEFRHNRGYFNCWVQLSPGQDIHNCEFDPNRFEYRIAPSLVNGVEVPRPLSAAEAAKQTNWVFVPKLVALPWRGPEVIPVRYRVGNSGTSEAIREGFAFKHQRDAVAYGKAFFAPLLEPDYYE